MKKNLLTIGEMSKRTGCSIKSLRYYNSIGVLKPFYVDSATNYRYYTFEQIRLVDMIQIFLTLGIPLKDFKALAIKEDNKIDYSDLIEYGKIITKEKINNLKHNLNMLESLQQDIERITSYENNESKEFHIDEKFFYTLPLYEDEMNNNYYNTLDILMTDALNKKLLFKHEYGVIITEKHNIINKFVAIEVDKKNSNLEGVIKIPANTFLCKKTNEFNLNRILHMFSHIDSWNKTIIISPGYSYNLSTPFFEVKCSINSK